MTEAGLTLFVAWMHTRKLASGTMKGYLAAVRHAQIEVGLGDPRMGNMSRLEYVLKGAKRLSRPAQRTRLPISPEILRGMKGVWQRDPNARDTTMLWSAATMCFFGFLRAGEVVAPGAGKFDPAIHLAHGDVRVNDPSDPQYVEVRIKASKTDPFRQGVSVYLGRTQGELFPVAAALSYMVCRGPQQGPFFTFADGRPLTRERFVAAVQAALAAAGYDCSKYVGHSFRIGAATTAAQRGVQDSLIKTLGRWESSAYTLYVRTPREVLCAVAGTLVGR